MLTKRERVLASIRRKALDVIPWQFDLTSAVQEKMKAYYGTGDLLSAMDDHFVCVSSRPPKSYTEKSPEPGLVQDEFGVIWHRDARDRIIGDWGGVESYPIKGPSLAGYRFPDGAAPGRWDYVPEIRQKHPDHFLMASGRGLFVSAWSLCGFENYLSYIGNEPNFVEELTEKLADFSCLVTAQLKGLGVDGIRFADDWGLQETLMIRLDTWRRLFKKHYRRIYEAAHKVGLIVMIHSCGNITELLPDFIELGVEVVHPLQPEAMDVTYCKRKFGRDLTFWGGLGSQSTIPNGTPEDNRREVRSRLKLFNDGGYILAPAGAIPTEAPAENVAAIVEAAREQFF